MRILITNPDRIGDFILRQPMFDALLDEGHQLLLVVRSFVSPLASLVVPRAAVAQCHLDPYSPRFDQELGSLDPLISRVQDFQPELIVVAPHQRTRLDEYVVERCPDVPTVALSGYLYRGEISVGLDARPTITFSRTVTVSTDDRELRKNELLCSAILDRNVRLPSPSIRADETMLTQARRRLEQLGLQPGEYWIACVGHSGWNVVRNWGVHQWAKALAHMVERHGLHFLFAGTPEESEITEQVRHQMGAASAKTASLCFSPEGLDLLAGLTAESAGYVGKDTGPMHFAAALSKPVVAVFGGGDWPRFVPAAPRGAALTVSVPCAGCHWICHLPESHCVKRVPIEAVVDQLEMTVNGMEGFRLCEIKADRLLSNRMAIEAAESARNVMRSSNGVIRDLSSRVDHLGSLLDAERLESREQMQTLEERVRTLEEHRQTLEEQILTLKAEAGQLHLRYGRLESEHSHALANLDAIRRSVFARTLIALRIWRIF